MSAPISLTSELDAVNLMLWCCAEAPVVSLEDSGFDTADDALRLLRQQSRAVQARGYHWNSETDYPLYPDEAGHITLPENCLKVDEVRWASTASRDVVNRGTRLYDKKRHSYEFDSVVQADLVLALPWEELPEAARQYIAISAARQFQVLQLGSDTQHRLTAEQEAAAAGLLLTDEVEAGDYNMLTGSWSVAQILQGRR